MKKILIISTWDSFFDKKIININKSNNYSIIYINDILLNDIENINKVKQLFPNITIEIVEPLHWTYN